jgi:hypothetical protein
MVFMTLDNKELAEYLRTFLYKNEEDANMNEEGCCFTCERIRDEINRLDPGV